MSEITPILSGGWGEAELSYQMYPRSLPCNDGGINDRYQNFNAIISVVKMLNSWQNYVLHSLV